jgi:hypothetical protein
MIAITDRQVIELDKGQEVKTVEVEVLRGLSSRGYVEIQLEGDRLIVTAIMPKTEKEAI